MKRFALSTSDNPFNPFEDFDRWFAFDSQKGYHSSSLLARTAAFSSELADADQNRIVEQAIDSIIELNATGNYIKVIDES